MVQWSQPHLVKQSNKICSLHCCWISDTPLNGGCWFSHPTSHPDHSPTIHTLLPLFQPKARAASLSAELAQIKDWSDTASSQRKYVKQLQFVQRTYGKEKQFIGLEGGILTYLNWKPWFLPRNIGFSGQHVPINQPKGGEIDLSAELQEQLNADAVLPADREPSEVETQRSARIGSW